ncbi:hypothetical protein Tco_0746837 [Tanacetum coccineum]
MDKIKSVNPNAHKYLMDKNPKTWPRAFFEVDRGCEAIKNRLSECFNSVIVNVRHKPLLTVLEDIRVIVLERMNKVSEISRKWNPGVCPNIKKRLESLKEQQRMWQLSGIPWASGSRGGASGSRGGSSGSRGRGGAKGSRGGASGSRGGASISKGGAGGYRGGARGSRGIGAARSKRKLVSSDGTQKRQGKKKVWTSGYAKWFRL